MPREKIGTDAITVKRDRLLIESELKDAVAQKQLVEGITNSAKNGTLDVLKERILERLTKAGLSENTLEFNGFNFIPLKGVNVSYSRGSLLKAMQRYGIDPDKQELILMEGARETPFTALQISAVKAMAE